MKHFNPSELIKEMIVSSGGFVNCHAHIDRAFTVTEENLNNECEKFLTEKWIIVDNIKSQQTEEEYYRRMRHAIISQMKMNVSDICTFIDVDSVVGYKALKAAKRVRKDFEHKINIKLACQTLKGVVDKKERKLLEYVIDDFDVIGSLPAADSDWKKHLDIVMSWSKDTGKKLHIHVDQLNRPDENETKIVTDFIPKYNLENKVVGVHGISIASKPKSKRFEIYSACKDLGMGFISCPSAWIDHRRSDELQPWHNATTPVEEMVKFGIDVGLGTDNICDIYKPFSDGNMMTELKFILESCHIYNKDILTRLATNKNII